MVTEGIEARWGSELERAAPGAIRWVCSPGAVPPDHSALEVIYFSGDVYPHGTRDLAMAALKADNLRWLHSFSAGVDDAFFQTLLGRGVRLTTSAGVQAVPIAQTVMMYLLALSRDLPGWLKDQEARRWNARPIRDLQGQHLGIVGLGPIGLAVARLAAAFGMRVTGLRRRPRGDEPCRTCSLAELPNLIPDFDALVLALPLTDSTRNLMDVAAISRMRRGAILVNIARGELVDEVALVEALEGGHLGGAGLDVFEQEPLPADSPLWHLPNVIITPHRAGTHPGNAIGETRIFLENLERYERGEVLFNEVDPRDVSGPAMSE